MTDDQETASYRQYIHSPSHLFLPGGTYIVTASTYLKELFFNTPAKRDFLQQTLFEEAERWGWKLEAWAIMANHYHFIGKSPAKADTLVHLITALHSKTAILINKLDNTRGRKVWYRYWDTCLTYERSYLARLNYVHNNPVKHHLVANAEEYRWCSMTWFVNNAEPAFQRIVLSFKTDQVSINDEY
jgi:putative transposase